MPSEHPELDADFERWLLDSARREAAPVGLTERAWTRFTQASGRLAASAASSALPSWLGVRVSRASLAWLGAGLGAGSALTAALLWSWNATAPGAGSETTGLAAPMVAAPVAVAPVVAARQDVNPGADAHRDDAMRGDAAPALPTAPDSRASESNSNVAQPRAAERPRARREPPARAPLEQQRSTLPAEVRALDAVRAAIEAGHADRALAGVASFHDSFPRAQLAADADGLAIEALLAKGDRDAAARRAARFLRDYPEDPHATRFAPIAAPR